MAIKYQVKTLGCKANLLDSQVIESNLSKEGWITTDSLENTDVLIVNTCTVTDEADKQSRKEAILSLRKNPNLKVVLTGCGAEVAPDDLLNQTGAHFIIGNQNKNNFASLLVDALSTGKTGLLGEVKTYSELRSQHPMDREWPLPDSAFNIPEVSGTSPQSTDRLSTARTRAFIKIQEGCNSFCTYCIIPYGRGPSRSLNEEKLIEQIHEIAESGTDEVVITGTNIGEYGEERNPIPSYKTERFDGLVSDILNKTNLKRLRLSSLDPSEISDELLSFMLKSDRLMPHFHISLQSPEDRVLRLMKRKYKTDAYLSVTEKIKNLSDSSELKTRAPGGIFIGMDVITGFPGEGEEEFQETISLLKKTYWNRLHVFPYSEREGTPATRLKNKVPNHIRKERAKILRELSFERLKSTYQNLLNLKSSESSLVLNDILFESPVKGPDPSRVWLSGYTKNYFRVFVPFLSLDEAKKWVGKTASAIPQSLYLDKNGGDVAFLAGFLES